MSLQMGQIIRFYILDFKNWKNSKGRIGKINEIMEMDHKVSAFIFNRVRMAGIDGIYMVRRTNY